MFQSKMNLKMVLTMSLGKSLRSSTFVNLLPLRTMLQRRMKIAELKQVSARPDVVEVWDATSADPKLLVFLKSYRNTVPVPRHWSQKRKYLQENVCDNNGAWTEKNPNGFKIGSQDGAGITVSKHLMEPRDGSSSLDEMTKDQTRNRLVECLV